MADAVTACQKGIPMTVSALDRRTALVLIDRQTGTAATRNNRTTPPMGWRTRCRSPRPSGPRGLIPAG
jgi:hypothetical protein